MVIPTSSHNSVAAQFRLWLSVSFIVYLTSWWLTDMTMTSLAQPRRTARQPSLTLHWRTIDWFRRPKQKNFSATESYISRTDSIFTTRVENSGKICAMRPWWPWIIPRLEAIIAVDYSSNCWLRSATGRGSAHERTRRHCHFWTGLSFLRASVPGSSNKLGDWVIEWVIKYASFLHGIAQQRRSS